jgi:hypothetical protein
MELSNGALTFLRTALAGTACSGAGAPAQPAVPCPRVK